MLQALFQGKKVVIDHHGFSKVTLYPPRYGYFMTYEKFHELESRLFSKAWEGMLEILKGVKKDAE